MAEDDRGLAPKTHVDPLPTRSLGKRESRSASGRRRGDSAHPLDFSTNRTIGRFELIREIARGGMGQVFLGRDTKLGRKVAIKFLLRDDAHFVQRFLVEARATARCTHENIVTIFEVGEHERLPYMVLEYLEGKTLSAVLESKPSVRQFCELMMPVLRALERAHEHGIVHRDLKPSNIFVTERGQVKVLDFGVARLIGRDEREVARASAMDFDAVAATEMTATMTGADHVIGTLPYMSPEQWGLDVVDHQSDLWAIGVMFWRALVQAHPTGTLKPDKLRARVIDLDTPLPSIAARDPALPDALVAIVDRCLAKSKPERYASASEVLADLQAFLAPASERPSDDACPFRGLSAFGEDDAKYFFGRDSEIRSALAQLDVWPLLAVIGPSGVGKSSFVHAGLVPAVRSAGGSWQVHVLRPGRVPVHRLANVLEDATGQDGSALMAQLVEAPGLFGATLRAAALRRNANILVVVDQLEELFTLCDSDQVRRMFLAALLGAADDPTSPVRVVLSMRADFLDRLAGHQYVLAELSRGMFFLTAPDQDNLRETLVRPAELAGYAFESPQIVEDMLQVATSRGALPLLSFAAMRLWDARDRKRKLLTVAAYEQMGGVGGAFARHADQVASAVPPQSQPLLRAIMTRLVTPEGTRAVVDHRELVSLAGDRREVERILDQLVQARLIQLHTDPAHGATVEIVHEMLITEWPTLARWLEDGKAVRAFQHELRQAAKQWHARGKPGDLVWRGATAQEALASVRRHVLELSESEREFVAAIRRRRVMSYVWLATAAAVVIAGVTLAFVRITLAQHEAKEKAQQALAAEAKLAEQVRQLQAEKQARASAERKTDDIQHKLTETEALSRQELEDANRQLQQQVQEAEDARRKAQAEEARARKAGQEAEAARQVTEQLLREKQKQLDDLAKRKREIIDVDLTKGGK
ncbi:MAG TPA: protein kinase [Kofleriaceae bacterium]|nr:protein kinase [Kofleriaceae bacterium]